MPPRIIGVETSPIITEMDMLYQGILSNYENFVSGQPVQQCPGNGTFLDDFGPPQLLILDVRF